METVATSCQVSLTVLECKTFSAPPSPSTCLFPRALLLKSYGTGVYWRQDIGTVLRYDDHFEGRGGFWFRGWATHRCVGYFLLGPNPFTSLPNLWCRLLIRILPRLPLSCFSFDKTLESSLGSMKELWLNAEFRIFVHSESIKSTIERYKNACADSSNSGAIIDVNSQQYYQQESAKLRHQIQTLQNANRHLMGDALSSLSVKELKQLENRLERGITRIRSKKHELLFSEIEYMQRREVELQNDNMCLRAKIAENEQAALQVSIAQEGPQFDALPAFDSRNYYHVNLLEAATHYSHQQDQTALHLGYEARSDHAA